MCARSGPGRHHAHVLPCGTPVLDVNALELKIPPVAVALAVAAAMWFASSILPLSIQVPIVVRALAAAILALLGAGVGIAGIIEFRRARTTVNPIKPDTASVLVTSGIYRVSRNPMYLGMLFALIAWAAFMSDATAFIVASVFVPYLNRFQIAPEEWVLSARFGAEFADYKARVRRWL